MKIRNFVTGCVVVTEHLDVTINIYICTQESRSSAVLTAKCCDISDFDQEHVGRLSSNRPPLPLFQSPQLQRRGQIVFLSNISKTKVI